MRRKSLLIGINYTGTPNELHGCYRDIDMIADFLSYRKYSAKAGDQVILRDDNSSSSPFYPTGHNILAAMDWLVADSHTCCFLHYSGHGGQVPDLDGDRESGFDDTIVPVDFARHGQLDSSLLHRHLVSRLPPSSSLFALFDCCHSGSVIELPFVYRSDEHGNVNLMETVDKGLDLIDGARHLIRGPVSMRGVSEARELYAESKVFFEGLLHIREGKQTHLGAEKFLEHWEREKKMVTLLSGCKDEQTSSDTRVEGVREGAMSWAFLEVMRSVPNPTYVQTLKDCRAILKRSKYAQIPQLSVGMKFDLKEPLVI